MKNTGNGHNLSGIMQNGYGPIFRFVMCDPSVSFGAKGLYGYICSFGCGNDTCYPSLETIADDLCISTRTVIKYLKELREKDLIFSKHSTIVKNGRPLFSSNHYWVNFTPASYHQADLQQQKFRVTGNISEYGTGIVPKAVMVDKELSFGAKCLYAYYCAIMGEIREFNLKRDKTLLHLNINKSTLGKYNKELKQKYIAIENSYDNARITGTKITLKDRIYQDAVNEKRPFRCTETEAEYLGFSKIVSVVTNFFPLGIMCCKEMSSVETALKRANKIIDAVYYYSQKPEYAESVPSWQDAAYIIFCNSSQTPFINDVEAYVKAILDRDPTFRKVAY